MLISKKMNTKLNEQINNEQYSAHLYLAMATTFDEMGLKIFGKYYYKQAEEELQHAMKILHYIVDVGGVVELKAIAEPGKQGKSVQDIVQAALDHEIKVTGMINDLAALADSEKDYTTRSFLNWFIDEQVEEVSSAQELLDLVKMTPPVQILNLESRVYRMLEG